jgi:hypothetical protein
MLYNGDGGGRQGEGKFADIGSQRWMMKDATVPTRREKKRWSVTGIEMDRMISIATFSLVECRRDGYKCSTANFAEAAWYPDATARGFLLVLQHHVLARRVSALDTTHNSDFCRPGIAETLTLSSQRG